MSESSNTDKPAAVPIEQLTAADRKKARARHMRRYLEQLVFGLLTIALAAASVPIEHASMMHPRPYGLGPESLLALIFLGAWIVLITYHRIEQSSRWDKAISKAQALLNPQTSTRGYTQVFGIYVESKRLSAQLLVCAAVSFTYAFVGVISYCDLVPRGSLAGGGANAQLWFWGGIGGLIAAGLLLLARAYALNSSCLPGDVIVRHTLALALHATSNVNDEQDARRQIEQDTQAFMRESPWWFYPG